MDTVMASVGQLSEAAEAYGFDDIPFSLILAVVIMPRLS